MLFFIRQHQDAITHRFNQEETMMTIINPKIQNQALLVKPRITKWNRSKKSKKLSDALAKAKKIKKGSAKVYLEASEHPVVKSLSTLSGRIRNQIVTKLTVPWDHDGTKLLPVGLVDRFQKEIGDAIARHEELLAELRTDYDEVRDRAKDVLGDNFEEVNFPAVDELIAEYSVTVTYAPLPTGGDLRVSLPQKKLDKLRKEVEASVKSNIEKGTKQVHERVVGTLTHLIGVLNAFGVDKKSGKAVGVFRNSTVKNLNDLAEVLSVLNITGDPKLTAASNDLLVQLRDLNPKKLRKDKTHRKDVAKKAQKIVDNLSGYYD